MTEHTVYPKNTSVWAFNALRQDALPRLLDDLSQTSTAGIPDEVCKKIKQTHDSMTDIASSIPDKSFFRKSVWKAFDEYSEAYSKWNDISGENDDAQKKRSSALKKVRSKRNSLATIVRRNFSILSKELDIMIVDSMYRSLSDLAKNYPTYFVELSKAVIRYDSRRSESE